jgi:DNA polymerase elongation subunit (family B)
MNIPEDTLIYDIECGTPTGVPNPQKDILRVFGCYSYKHKKPFILTNIDEAKKLFSQHKYLVGYNNRNYDDEVLKRYGFDFKYKTIIDMFEVIDKRQKVIYHKKGVALYDELMSQSLDYVTKIIGLVTEEDGKGTLDYSLLNKQHWTTEEAKNIYYYTKRDIEITKKLYEWLEKYFESSKKYVTQQNINRKEYLVSTPADYTYSVICTRLNWTEDKDFNVVSEHFDGAYVGYPAGAEFKGRIRCKDFNSLYPHLFALANLYSPVGPGEQGWHGNDVFKVEGTYKTDGLGKIESLLMEIYKERQQLKKKGDPAEQTLKLVINTAYGISGSPKFKHLYNPVTAADCTRLGRQCIFLARKMYTEYGYKVIYTDTDSVYVLDPFEDDTKLDEVTKKIVDKIKANVPFPQDTFDMGTDAKIKYMFFFKGKNKVERDDKFMDELDIINKPKGYKKKNYIYVTEDNKLVVKNLIVKQKSCSPLTRKIFWDDLAPQIIEKGKIKFSKAYLSRLVDTYLKDDLSLIQMRVVAKPLSEYKSNTSKQAQATLTYGPGIHFLIPNLKNIGCGKGKKFCTLEEYKKHNLQIKDIDLSGVWSELETFIKPVVTKNIFAYTNNNTDESEFKTTLPKTKHLNSGNAFSNYEA